MVLNKIGLTGATGMLGRHLQVALRRAGAQVIAATRKGALDSGVPGWDLTEWQTLTELDTLFSDVQAVVHAGAMVPASGPIDEGQIYNANCRACVNLGQWALSRGVPVVHISSSTVYADTTSADITEDAPLGWSGLGGAYGFSKLLAEDAFRHLAEQGLKVAVVRPSSLYGCGLPGTKMMSHFLATAREGRAIELISPVDDKVDFIHALDVARAIVAILAANAWATFNIASGCTVSIKGLAEACIAVAGRGSIVIAEDKVQARDPMTRFALNTDFARSRLGWHPSLELRQGLQLMLKQCVEINEQGLDQN